MSIDYLAHARANERVSSVTKDAGVWPTLLLCQALNSCAYMPAVSVPSSCSSDPGPYQASEEAQKWGKEGSDLETKVH